MNRMEELRVQKMMRLGCCACAYIEIPFVAHECHHLLYGNRQMGDWFTIPLCLGHHQGGWSPEQIEVLKPEQRVAISDGRKAFSKVYPTERELWDRVQERLGLAWPQPKLVARATSLSSSGSLSPID